MQSQSEDSLLHGSAPSSCGGDGDQCDPYPVLQCSVLPDAINLGRQKESAQSTLSPHQLRLLALKLQEHPHVTALDLSNQCIGADAILELAGHFVPPPPLTTTLHLRIENCFCAGTAYFSPRAESFWCVCEQQQHQYKQTCISRLSGFACSNCAHLLLIPLTRLQETTSLAHPAHLWRSPPRCHFLRHFGRWIFLVFRRASSSVLAAISYSLRESHSSLS
jgi:hypothetical protein